MEIMRGMGRGRGTGRPRGRPRKPQAGGPCGPCPLCALSFSHPSTFKSVDHLADLADIIYKHLQVKVADEDRAKVCWNCIRMVSAWNEYAQKIWKVQSDMENKAVIEIKPEKDDSDFGGEEPVDDFEYDIKLENPLSDTSSDESEEEVKPKMRTRQKETVLMLACHVCSIRMDDWSLLREHCRNEHACEPDVLCPCGKYLTTECAFNKHQSLHGRKNDIKEEDNSNDGSVDKEKKRREKIKKPKMPYVDLKCHICFIECKNFNALKTHCKSEHSTEPRLSCSCGKIFKTHGAIRYHKLRHATENELRCQLCKHKKICLHSMTHEKDQKSSEESVFSCAQCPKKFPNKLVLQTHIKGTHTGVKYPCDVCGALLCTPLGLVSHKNTYHEKISTYVCDMCGKTFCLKNRLQEHILTHTNERRFKCDKCDFRFKTSSHLKRHREVHQEPTTMKCPKCPSTFKGNRNLRLHMVTHSDVFNYVCKYCGKGFKRSKNLRVHVDSHEGVKRYKCEWCPKVFSNGQNLNIHKKNVHAVIPGMNKSQPQDSRIDSTEA